MARKTLEGAKSLESVDDAIELVAEATAELKPAILGPDIATPLLVVTSVPEAAVAMVTVPVVAVVAEAGWFCLAKSSRAGRRGVKVGAGRGGGAACCCCCCCCCWGFALLWSVRTRRRRMERRFLRLD